MTLAQPLTENRPLGFTFALIAMRDTHLFAGMDDNAARGMVRWFADLPKGIAVLSAADSFPGGASIGDFASGSTAATASETERPDFIGWLDDNRLRTIVGLTRRAVELFGPDVSREVSFRSDPERLPPEYAVVVFTVQVPGTAALVDSENRLIDYLVEVHASVEDDFVVVCRRRHR